MNIYVPGGLIAVFISLFYFYSFKKRKQLKKENRKERLAQLQEDLLATLREKPVSFPSDERGPSTNAQDKLATEAL